MSRDSSPGSTLAHIRGRTRELHERAEALIDLPTLRTVERYRTLLSLLLGFHAPLERRLAHVDLHAVGLDLDARLKAHLLEDDLRCLGVEPRQVPACSDLPALPALPEALGCLYVLEGSTLGGQVISRHLRETMGIVPGEGGSFFASDGRDVGAMWRAFCRALAAGCPGEPEAVRAAESAVRTFSSFNHWLAAAPTFSSAST
ncbi:MAG: biliverdin-producing heme oxygenase [Byssovorax sp.]